MSHITQSSFSKSFLYFSSETNFQGNQKAKYWISNCYLQTEKEIARKLPCCTVQCCTFLFHSSTQPKYFEYQYLVLEKEVLICVIRACIV